ncbi:helix-turn-helix transcriptional regulator [Collinsella sp. An307]|uniref:helix-turn-helix transcriptional regulator n=1 Tax=Collinsella sp. An307 TaxID=1965630 RepID=UPI0031B80EB0
MPLMSTAYTPGTAKAFVASLARGTRASVAQAELAYFSGNAERARDLAAPLLKSDDPEARLSACLICAFSNLSLGRINDARFALDGALGNMNSEMGGTPSEVTAMAAFIGNAASALLHLPAPTPVQHVSDLLSLLPPGLRLFACYVKAHRLYLEGAYEQSYGIVLGAFVMADTLYPIPAIYLHLAAVMNLMALRRTDEARQHVLAAWDIARPDGLIQPLGEHHGLLGGMLEAAIKPAWQDDFKRMIDITYRFSAGWRRVHNPQTADDVADNLTTTEFAVCMLASRDWSNAEIAEHMGFSVNRVKECLSNAFRKLGVTSRKDLSQFMLA